MTRPVQAAILSLGFCMGATVFGQTADDGSLSETEKNAMTALSAKQLQELGGHAELAEYMRLRVKSKAKSMPSPGEEIAHYAMKSLGQPYRKGAWVNDLLEADCVTFTERCIALGCTDNWLAARKLQYRLRFKDGLAETGRLNQDPILHWIPANAWLFEEITEQLGASIEKYQLSQEGRTVDVHYAAKASFEQIADHLQTGDILLFIADRPDPPNDPVMRTRCVHMAILLKSSTPGASGEDGQAQPSKSKLEILQSYPPTASRWPLERFFRNRYTRGAKILRLKPGARAIVAQELTQMGTRFEATVNQVDNQAKLQRGEVGFLTLKRVPDSTLTNDGILYGMITLQPKETLWHLFGPAYKGICGLPINQPFMSRHADLKAEEYQGDSIYYPIRPATDTNDDPPPPKGNVFPATH